MSNTMTGPLEAYFEGRNARDLARALSGFSETAVVHDESRIHRGPQEIRAWMTETIAAYDDRSELLDVEADGDTFIATARVSGNFPGGPITLRYRFATERGLISSLEIAP
ncbi:nuclear transport factor 2 family protein [Rhizobium rosettiformans]|uniref:Nuclear transport factor 2 family protein n=1 Tax=Rhizobium rosettiformans TaxID=1368430 RepID=A0ABX7EZU6_9HYPH|nr:nuclear transport factor 2 family protein [Rhizobium rosettiformans]QRF52951.1 nuclear transport factor 2 family protein [Rhizobium rosettiformans]